MVRARGWSAVLAAVLALSGGCAGGHRPPPPVLSEQAVMRAFRAATGIEPNVAVSSARLGYVLDGDFAAAGELRTYQRLFGGFGVYVAGPAGAATVARMLGHTVPDAAGIRWRRTTEQGVTEWTAVKRYGRNVVVSWSAPPSARVVDRRWKNLDRLLRAVADRAAGQPARGR